jgi:hypothetical protein
LACAKLRYVNDLDQSYVEWKKWDKAGLKAPAVLTGKYKRCLENIPSSEDVTAAPSES